MAFERKWAAVSPQPFTSNGTAFGLVTIVNTCGFYVKQSVYLTNTAGLKLALQVKKVISVTQLYVGAIDNSKIGTWPPYDISTWTVASGAAIGAEEQQKNNIQPDDHYSAVYEGDPIAADRVIPVDCNGNKYGPENPFPVTVDGTISIGQIRVTACDNDPNPGDQHSSIRISDCTNDLKINADGSINSTIVNTPSTGQNVISRFNEVLALASNATATLMTYTVPVNTESVLQRIHFSGSNIGKYDVFINGVKQDTARTMFGADLTGEFNFTSGNTSGLTINAGDIVTVQVNNPRPYIGDYEARLQVLEIAL